MELALSMLKGAKCGCRLLQAKQGVGLPPFLEGPRIVSLEQSALERLKASCTFRSFSCGAGLCLCRQGVWGWGEGQPHDCWVPSAWRASAHSHLRIPLAFQPVHVSHQGDSPCLFFLKLSVDLGLIYVGLCLMWLLTLLLKMISPFEAYIGSLIFNFTAIFYLQCLQNAAFSPHTNHLNYFRNAGVSAHRAARSSTWLLCVCLGETFQIEMETFEIWNLWQRMELEYHG